MTIYEQITKDIIAKMDEGIIPWHKPWNGGKYNRISKTEYSFLNQLLLPYDGEYASFKQWNSIGGKIKKGAKASYVVFWNIIRKKDDETENEIIIPILRYYNVFHISQVVGVESLDNMNKNEKSKNSEDVIKNYFERETCKLEVEKRNSAFYNIQRDEIHVPNFNQYIDRDEYYSTLFHEMIHSTGACSRLNRLHSSSFGDDSYCKEELIAEIGSAMLCGICKLDSKKTFKNSVAYLQGWKSKLKEDSHLIVNAASKAEKAVKYILNES